MFQKELHTKALKLVSFWNPERGHSPEFMPSKLTQLSGQHINVSVIGLPPFIVYYPDRIGGMEVEVVRILSRKMGFTFQMKPEMLWGLKISGDNWDGIVGSVSFNASILVYLGIMLRSIPGKESYIHDRDWHHVFRLRILPNC